MRVFKKRILILDTMVCRESGGRTFIEEFLQTLDSLDIVVDYLTYGGTDECISHFKNFNNMNEFIALNKDMPDLQRYRLDYENKKAFYGVYFHNPFTDAMVISKVHELLNTYIYDNIFINHVDNYPAMSNYFPLSSMINTFTYTHCCQTFTDTPAFNMGAYEKLNTTFLRDILAKDTQIDIITQKTNRFVEENFPNNQKLIIGLPLDVDKFHNFFNPDEVQDSVLFLGRFNQTAKNMKGWVSTLAKTNLKGVIIVPTKKNADSFIALMEKLSFTNYEIHYDLSFEEKMKVSSKCKVCFIPSFIETFSFVAYENLSIMKVVAIDREWSSEFKNSLSEMILTSEEDAPKVLEETVKNWNKEDIIKQYNTLIKFNDEISISWSDYLLNKEHKYTDSPKRETQIINALIENNNLPSALKSLGKDSLEFTEISTLYRNIIWDDVIQTKEASSYREVSSNNTEEFYNEW